MSSSDVIAKSKSWVETYNPFNDDYFNSKTGNLTKFEQYQNRSDEINLISEDDSYHIDLENSSISVKAGLPTQATGHLYDGEIYLALFNPGVFGDYFNKSRVDGINEVINKLLTGDYDDGGAREKLENRRSDFAVAARDMIAINYLIERQDGYYELNEQFSPSDYINSQLDIEVANEAVESLAEFKKHIIDDEETLFAKEVRLLLTECNNFRGDLLKHNNGILTKSDKRKKYYYIYKYFFALFAETNVKGFKKIFEWHDRELAKYKEENKISENDQEFYKRDFINFFVEKMNKPKIANIEFCAYRSSKRNDLSFIQGKRVDSNSTRFSVALIYRRIQDYFTELRICEENNQPAPVKPYFFFRGYNANWLPALKAFEKTENTKFSLSLKDCEQFFIQFPNASGTLSQKNARAVSEDNEYAGTERDRFGRILMREDFSNELRSRFNPFGE